MDIAITVSNREIKPAVINFFQHENQTVKLNFTLDSYMYEEVDLRNYKAYGVTVQNGFVDMTELEMNYDSADDKLMLSWEVQEYSLRQVGAINYQIVFKENADDGENTAVFYTYKGIMINRGSVDGDNHITANYPTILKQWLDKIEELAGTMEAGIIYIPYDETIPVSDRLAGRIYFQYTDSYNTEGRFEDHEGNELNLSAYLPLSGGTMSGILGFTNDGVNVRKNKDNSNLVISGGVDTSSSTLKLNGKNSSDKGFVLSANDGSSKVDLQGSTSGGLTWGGKNVVRTINNTTANESGNVNIDVGVKTVNGLTPDSAGDVTVSTIKANGSDSFSQVRGGASVSDGARLNVFGKDYAENPGDFALIANDGSNSKSLIGKPNGDLSWDGNPIVTCSTAGTILNKGTTIIRQESNSLYTQIFGGDTYKNGAYLRLNGKDEASGGSFVLSTGNGSENKSLIGKPDGTLTWNGGNVLTNFYYNATDDSLVNINGGSQTSTGASLNLYGTSSAYQGIFHLISRDDAGSEAHLIGYPTGNLTWKGKSHTSWSMPGTRTVNLTTTDKAVTTFTAPADGWYCIKMTTTTRDYNLYIVNTTTGVGMNAAALGGESYACCPAKNGDTVKIYRNGTVNYCRFVYAYGTP